MKQPFTIIKGGQLDHEQVEKAISRLYDCVDDTPLQKPLDTMQDFTGLSVRGSGIPQGLTLSYSIDNSGTQWKTATITAIWSKVTLARSYDVQLLVGTDPDYTIGISRANSETFTWHGVQVGTTVRCRVRAIFEQPGDWSVEEEAVIQSGTKLDTPQNVSAKMWFRFITGKFDVQKWHRFKGVRYYEWSVMTSNTTPTGVESATEEIYRSTGHVKVMWVPSLDHKWVSVRTVGWGKQYGEWTTPIDATIAVTADITSITVGLLPLKTGWFKRTQWRFNLEWAWSTATGGDAELDGRFDIQYRRLTNAIGASSTFGPKVYHAVDLDADDQSPEHNIPLVFPPRNMTVAANGYTVGDKSNIIFRIRAREGTSKGPWFPATGTTPQTIGGIAYTVITKDEGTLPDSYWIQVPFVAADDSDDTSAPTGGSFTVKDDGPFGRFINVVCCDGGWDAPNTFSHFSIHARIGSTSPDTWTASANDRIHGCVGLEDGINGVSVRVPLFIYNQAGTPALQLFKTKDFDSGTTHLQIKIVPHIWTGSKLLPSPVYASASASLVPSSSDTATMAAPTTLAISYTSTFYKRFVHLSCVAPTNEDEKVRYYEWRIGGEDVDHETPTAWTYTTIRSIHTDKTTYIPWFLSVDNVYCTVKAVGHNGVSSSWVTRVELSAPSVYISDPVVTKAVRMGNAAHYMLRRVIYAHCAVDQDDIIPLKYEWIFYTPDWGLHTDTITTYTPSILHYFGPSEHNHGGTTHLFADYTDIYWVDVRITARNGGQSSWAHLAISDPEDDPA